ncbi:hypothetical protein [Desulfurella sp.]|uniref:hypothetical protein n=1 Tax=Desulfurella sp. TaxID=1962857 RepID=UPI0025BEF2DD|nr:hypothetical protein [Desulfurella sp.]
MDIELKLNDVKLSEITEFIKNFRKNHFSIMDLIEPQIKDQVQNYVSNLVKIEFDNHIKRARYERIKVNHIKPNYRNGFYRRKEQETYPV